MLLTDVRSLVSAVQINKIAIVDLTRFWLKFENARLHLLNILLSTVY